jgi:ribosomal protein S18 acetylase RimI-like enzyme
VNYAIAEPSDLQDVIHLLARVFSESEPLAVAMNISLSEMEQFLRHVAPEMISDGLTVISRSKDSRLNGILLTDDFASPAALDVNQFTSKYLPILSMLDTLDEEFRRERTISPGECLHLFMLAVDGQFAGRGIGQGLVQACIDNGVRKGYRLAVTEATGKASQHIFRKNGFADRFNIAYRDFMYEDKAVFSSIRDHEKAILMERALF